jgi:hypothetical protein
MERLDCSVTGVIQTGCRPVTMPSMADGQCDPWTADNGYISFLSSVRIARCKIWDITAIKQNPSIVYLPWRLTVRARLVNASFRQSRRLSTLANLDSAFIRALAFTVPNDFTLLVRSQFCLWQTPCFKPCVDSIGRH